MTPAEPAGQSPELLYDGSPRCSTCPPRSRTSCIVGGCENPAGPPSQPDRAAEEEIDRVITELKCLAGSTIFRYEVEMVRTEVARLRAALDRQSAVVEAARALVERWAEIDVHTVRHMSPAFSPLLDALAREVRALESEQ